MNKSALNKIKIAGLSNSQNAIMIQKLGHILNQKIAQFETMKARNFDNNLIFCNALLFEISAICDEIFSIELPEIEQKLETKKAFEHKKSNSQKSLFLDFFIALCLQNLKKSIENIESVNRLNLLNKRESRRQKKHKLQ